MGNVLKYRKPEFRIDALPYYCKPAIVHRKTFIWFSIVIGHFPLSIYKHKFKYVPISWECYRLGRFRMWLSVYRSNRVFIFIQLKTNRALKKSFAVSLERLAPNLNIQTCWMREKKRQLKTKAWTIIESKILMTWIFFKSSPSFTENKLAAHLQMLASDCE